MIIDKAQSLKTISYLTIWANYFKHSSEPCLNVAVSIVAVHGTTSADTSTSVDTLVIKLRPLAYQRATLTRLICLSTDITWWYGISKQMSFIMVQSWKRTVGIFSGTVGILCSLIVKAYSIDCIWTGVVLGLFRFNQHVFAELRKHLSRNWRSNRSTIACRCKRPSVAPQLIVTHCSMNKEVEILLMVSLILIIWAKSFEFWLKFHTIWQ